jgi:hypothetical protein
LINLHNGFKDCPPRPFVNKPLIGTPSITYNGLPQAVIEALPLILTTVAAIQELQMIEPPLEHRQLALKHLL